MSGITLEKVLDKIEEVKLKQSQEDIDEIVEYANKSHDNLNLNKVDKFKEVSINEKKEIDEIVQLANEEV